MESTRRSRLLGDALPFTITRAALSDAGDALGSKRRK
jgi:hypothetical protein